MAITLTAERRSETGKKAAKALRASGRLPGNVYGGGLSEPLSVTFDLKEAERLIREGGRSGEYEVAVGGSTYAAVLKEVQREPIRKGFLHVDFAVKA